MNLLQKFMLPALLSASVLSSAWSAEPGQNPDAKPAPETPVKVACIGDSITAGAGIQDPGKNSYPARMQVYLGKNFEVRNYGVSGRTMQKAGDYPYWNEKAFADAKAFAPDIVLIKLGTNDTKPQNWKDPKRFEADTREMVEIFQKLPSKPRVYICFPVPVFKADQWGIRAAVVQNEVLPILRQVAYDTGADIINLHTPMLDSAKVFPDTVHPNAEGADIMAKRIAHHLSIPVDTKYSIVDKLPKDAVKSNFYGYPVYDFKLNGRACKIVVPKQANAGHSWAWRMEFFGHEPQSDLALLENGFHIAYIDTFGLNGSPLAMPHWEALYDFAVKAGLEKESALMGFSRGGLYSYNWAVAHPDSVSCIYGDAPVLDIRSWPGGKGKGKGSPEDWKTTLEQYKLTEETAAQWQGPLDKLDVLAKAKIPIIHVVGDADTVVPVAENTAILEERYKKLGGTVEVIHKPNCDHHPHSLVNPEPIVEFILKAYETDNAETPDEAFLKALSNAEYIVDGDKAKLENGTFSEPAAPGSATMATITLDNDMLFFGDMDGDNRKDAAVLLRSEPGGSGTFTYLALVLNEKNSAKPLEAILLGDRVTVKSATVRNGILTITVLDRNPGEPTSAAPSVESIREFKLQDNKLVEVK